MAEQKAGDIVITRTFDAPAAQVWRYWTEPALFKRWWGPKDFTVPTIKTDLRVGGRYLYCMRSPEGKDYWGTGVYREIAAPERLVLTDSFADEKGNAVSASHYGMGDDFPMELIVNVRLESKAGKTKLTLRHEGFPPGAMRDMSIPGWNESFDKLAEALQTEESYEALGARGDQAEAESRASGE